MADRTSECSASGVVTVPSSAQTRVGKDLTMGILLPQESADPARCLESVHGRPRVGPTGSEFSHDFAECCGPGRRAAGTASATKLCGGIIVDARVNRRWRLSLDQEARRHFCLSGRRAMRMRSRESSSTRREFIRRTSAAAAVLAGVPAGWFGGVYAADAPEYPKVRIGIIALTDCSSIVMAYELGLFKKHGIEATISKEASWAVIRDRLSLGENQATHMLLGMPYASTIGLLGAPVKPMIIPCYLNRNGQAITLTKALLD